MENQVQQWKNKADSLITNYYQVDPEVHRSLQAKCEEQTKELEAQAKRVAELEEKANSNEGRAKRAEDQVGRLMDQEAEKGPHKEWMYYSIRSDV